MKPKQAAIVNIFVSLVFAAAIIAAGFLLDETQHKETVMGLLIAAWWIPFSYLSLSGSRCC